MEPVRIFNVVNWSTDLNRFVLNPFELSCHWVDLLQEKLNLSRWLHNKTLVVNHDDLTHVTVIYLVVLVLRQVWALCLIHLTLSVKGINDILIGIIKAFDWEVPAITLHLVGNQWAVYFACHKVPFELVVGLAISVKKVHKNCCGANKATSNERVGEICYCYRKVIYSKKFIYLQFLIQDFFRGPWLEAKSSDPKQPIIHIGCSKVVPCKILFNLQHFNAGARKIFLKQNLVVCKAIHLDQRVLLIHFHANHNSRGIIVNDCWGNTVGCNHRILFQKVLKVIFVLLKLWIWVAYGGVSLCIFAYDSSGVQNTCGSTIILWVYRLIKSLGPPGIVHLFLCVLFNAIFQ